MAETTRLRRDDGGGRGTLVHVTAQVAKLFGGVRFLADGAEHQQLWVDGLRAVDDGGFGYAGNVFVAIRITEGGIGREIPFVVDTPVELQGMFIPANEAQAGQNDPGLPVLHFTHAPVGFVVYDGVTYR
ncbi:MAG: hypothetical protein INR65_16725 [Gluconacetobacter diazotrophicus]|nr:hypothetical protein [Gluconacetobacter diazotrophicus]